MRLVATLMALQAGYNGCNWEIAEARFADYIKAIQPKLDGAREVLIDARG